MADQIHLKIDTKSRLSKLCAVIEQAGMTLLGPVTLDKIPTDQGGPLLHCDFSKNPTLSIWDPHEQEHLRMTWRFVPSKYRESMLVSATRAGCPEFEEKNVVPDGFSWETGDYQPPHGEEYYYRFSYTAAHFMSGGPCAEIFFKLKP